MKSIFIPDFKDTIDAYRPFLSNNWKTYYPCVKYQIPADSVLDGTDTVYIAESMHYCFSHNSNTTYRDI